MKIYRIAQNLLYGAYWINENGSILDAKPDHSHAYIYYLEKNDPEKYNILYEKIKSNFEEQEIKKNPKWKEKNWFEISFDEWDEWIASNDAMENGWIKIYRGRISQKTVLEIGSINPSTMATSYLSRMAKEVLLMGESVFVNGQHCANQSEFIKSLTQQNRL